MGARSRNKGARGERELAGLLADRLGVEVLRNLSQTRDGGHDLDGLPFALEVKRCEKLAIQTWWDQAVEQAKAVGKPPALAYRQNRRPWRFVIPLAVVGETKDWCDAPWMRSYDYSCEVGVDGFCFVVREALISDAYHEVMGKMTEPEVQA